jgi:hypothetical protein
MSKMEFEWVLGALLLNTAEMVDTLLKIYWNVESTLYLVLSLIPIFIFNTITYIYFNRKKKTTLINSDNAKAGVVRHVE